jgi:hypothetical protein
MELQNAALLLGTSRKEETGMEGDEGARGVAGQVPLQVVLQEGGW